MAELHKRRDYIRPFEEDEVDANWDELDRRTLVEDESYDTMEKLATHLKEIANTKVIIKTANYTLDPTENDATIISEGKICTIDLITKTYPSAFTVAMKNDGAATNLVIVQKTGWSYQLNDADAVSLTTGGSNVTLTWTKGGTCTVILKGSTNKIMIDGGIE